MNELTLRLRGDRYLVRHLQAGDEAAVLDTFAHLSLDSLRYRFFTPARRLPPGIGADLTRTDDEGRTVLVAVTDDGRIAAEARAVRHHDDPSTADVAITVADEHQRRGLGTRMLRLLRTEARRSGIDRFVGHVLLDNAAGQRLLVTSRAVCRLDEPGVLAFEIPLRRRTVAPEVAARRTFGLAS